jgi:hypothetical protein
MPALSPRADTLHHLFWMAAALTLALAWRKLGGRQRGPNQVTGTGPTSVAGRKTSQARDARRGHR